MDTGVCDEEAGDLAVVEAADDDYKSVYDVPFITLMVDKAGTQYEGEVVLSGTAEVDEDRFRELLDIGMIYGQKVESLEYSPYDRVLVNFSPDAGLS